MAFFLSFLCRHFKLEISVECIFCFQFDCTMPVNRLSQSTFTFMLLDASLRFFSLLFFAFALSLCVFDFYFHDTWANALENSMDSHRTKLVESKWRNDRKRDTHKSEINEFRPAFRYFTKQQALGNTLHSSHNEYWCAHRTQALTHKYKIEWEQERCEIETEIERNNSKRALSKNSQMNFNLVKCF